MNNLKERILNQINSIPKLSINNNNEYISQLLIEEAKKRRELSKEIGITAYLNESNIPNPTKDINKVFLANTIRGVESHNRREETADCWRQHELQEKVHKERSSFRREKRKSEENQYNNDREYWAKLKEKRLLENSSNQLQTPPLSQTFVSSNSIQNSSPLQLSSNEDEDEEKESKKSKKQKKDKKEKKVKKKKNHKKHKDSKNND